MVTRYDGKTDRQTNKVHELQGGVLQLRNVNRLPELGAQHRLESAQLALSAVNTMMQDNNCQLKSTSGQKQSRDNAENKDHSGDNHGTHMS